MADTLISDVIEPALFTASVIQRTTEKSALWQAGLVSRDERIDNAIKAGGRDVTMPFWNDLSAAGADEVLSDTSPLTPANITEGTDAATVLYRGKAFSVNDLAASVAGEDPMLAIANQFGDYWAVQNQNTLQAVLRGAFATTLASTHVLDISDQSGVGAGAAEKFSDGAFLDACFKLGDNESAFAAICVHSTVYRTMLDLDLIEFVTPSEAAPKIPFYRGRRVIVDDGTYKVAGTTDGWRYYSFLFGPGAIGYGEAMPLKKPVEQDRDSLAGKDILINRKHFVLHPRGVKWVGNAAGSSPTNAELATGANWSRVYSVKNVRIVALITNG